MGSGKVGNFGNTHGNELDAISDFLTYLSLIPGVDTFADIIAIPIDIARGDFVSAGLDLLGIVPFLGESADTVKLVKNTDNVVDSVKVLDNTKDLGKSIEMVNPSKLIQTHKPTLSRKQFQNLVESIKKDGIIESVKYVEYNGSKYIVDGHHRFLVAKKLDLDYIPVEKVTLPYKGYKTIDDLLWFD